MIPRSALVSRLMERHCDSQEKPDQDKVGRTNKGGVKRMSVLTGTERQIVDSVSRERKAGRL